MGDLMHLLLVEDNPADADLMLEVMSDCVSGCNEPFVAKDGIEAMNYLHKSNGYECVTRPDIILLDLNLPRKSGKEVLAEIKEDPQLQTIPVIILSSSQAKEDIEQCYQRHANAYLIKPVDFSSLLDLVQSINDFWLKHVRYLHS